MLDKNVYGALDQKFNSAPTPVAVTPQVAVVPARPATVAEPEALIDDDFEQARTALKDMIRKGQTAVDDIMGIARQSDHPRAFEVTGQLIKTVAETAKDLLDLQKQKKQLTQPAAGEPVKQIGTQNNIVFSGSTNDLLKMLKNQNEPQVIDATDSQTIKK
jgi:hypothetical protein